MQNISNYLSENRSRFVEEWKTLLRIPSVSAKTEHNADMLRCAQKVEYYFQEVGIKKTKIFNTPGHPIVYAEYIHNPALPTVLVYGHYDVQPAEPFELWNTPPFEPTEKAGKIYARGACDDKGQFFMHLKAFEAMQKTGNLFTNLKFIIEGEEEVGSPNLNDFVKQNKEMLKADVILISDTGMLSLDTPSIDVGLRGLAYIEVEVVGPNRDLHSGVYGGIIGNPITILSQMISSCFDENNHITIPGFYDDVLTPTAQERDLISQIPFSDEKYKKYLGIGDFWGEKGYTIFERLGIRPTLELNGIWGGYTGEGAKTIIPSKATAKISCRIVPNQNHENITQKLINYFTSIAPKHVQVNCRIHHGGDPYLTPIDSYIFEAGALAILDTFGKRPLPIRGGASIPICSLFEKELGLKIMFLGFGLESDNLHSPNEKFDLFNFYKGIETIPYFHKHFSELWSKNRA